MPLYEFFCSECNKKHEELCSSSTTNMKCPVCGNETRKIISLFRTGGSSSGSGTASSNCGG